MSSPAAERGRRVRERLVAAAAELIPERGWTAVSTRILAERAGVAPSAVHYHFPSLQVVLHEATIGLVGRTLTELEHALDGCRFPSDVTDVIVTMLGRYTGTDPESLLAMEAYLAATRDERLRERIHELVEEARWRLSRRLDRYGVPVPDETAAVLLAATDGMLLHRGLGVAMRTESLAVVLRRLMSPTETSNVEE